jgi:hypothetical protein
MQDASREEVHHSGEAVSGLLLPPQHSFNSNLDAGGIAPARIIWNAHPFNSLTTFATDEKRDNLHIAFVYFIQHGSALLCF